MESIASSPRGNRLNRVEDDSCSPWQVSDLIHLNVRSANRETRSSARQ